MTSVKKNSKWESDALGAIFVFIYISIIFKENIPKIIWGWLLLSVWNEVVSLGWRMVVLLVDCVSECCSELGTRIAIPQPNTKEIFVGIV